MKEEMLAGVREAYALEAWRMRFPTRTEEWWHQIKCRADLPSPIAPDVEWCWQTADAFIALIPAALRASAAPEEGKRAWQLVCSNKPRPSVQKTGKGNQHWKRDVHHIAGADKVTLCKINANDWLNIRSFEPQDVDDPNLCERCKASALPSDSGKAAPVAWRCFHCGDSFTDEEAAREHFGPDTEWEAGCIDPLSRDEKIRRAEQIQFYKELDAEREKNSELLNRDYILSCWERDLAKHFSGAKSVHQAFLVLDAMEGRALAAEERAALAPATEGGTAAHLRQIKAFASTINERNFLDIALHIQRQADDALALEGGKP